MLVRITESMSGDLRRARRMAKRPTFMRWIVGVGMGFRQGETLGLRWPYVDLAAELFLSPVAVAAAHVAARLRRRPRLRGAPAPLRSLPAELHYAQGLQARLPQAVHADVRQAREYLP